MPAALALFIALAVAQSPEVSPIAASSTFDPRYQPEYALDGDMLTRWASGVPGAETQWLMLDFGRPMSVGSLTIRWEAAYAAEYALEISDDGAAWERVYETSEGAGGAETLPSVDRSGRYVRIVCSELGPFGVYSIWEVEGADDAGRAAIAAARSVLEERREAMRQRVRAELDQGVSTRSSTRPASPARLAMVTGTPTSATTPTAWTG
jgi:hypothetical protein